MEQRITVLLLLIDLVKLQFKSQVPSMTSMMQLHDQHAHTVHDQELHPPTLTNKYEIPDSLFQGFNENATIRKLGVRNPSLE